jgi:hypothetical protein
MDIPKVAVAMHNFMQYSWHFFDDIAQHSDSGRFLDAYDTTLSVDIGEAALNQVDSYWSFASEDVLAYPRT